MRRIVLFLAAALALGASAADRARAGSDGDPAARSVVVGAVAGIEPASAPADRGQPAILAFARTLELDRLLVPDDPACSDPLFGLSSYTLGSWQVLALNAARCRGSEGCAPGSPVLEWMRQELLQHARTHPCTLAIWEEPRFDWRSPREAAEAAAAATAGARAAEAAAAAASEAIGEPRRAGTEDAGGIAAQAPEAAWGDAVRPLFELLHQYGADIVIAGGARNYQRWQPLDPSGRPDSSGGLVQFIVGTGGSALEDFGPPPRPGNLAMAQSTSPGVLRLTLHDGAYDFEFVSTPGAPAFIDRGYGIGCH